MKTFTEDDLVSYLELWAVDSKGHGIPLTYSRLMREVSIRESNSFDVIEALESNGYIRICTNGSWTLTDKGVRERKPSAVDSLASESDLQRDAAWMKFRTLCEYYADCVHQSERTQEYLSENRLNIDFMLPALDPNWWDASHSSRVTCSERQSPVFNRLLLQKPDAEEEACIGYPLSGFTASDGRLCFTPVFLMPLKFRFNSSREIEIQVREDVVDVNRGWLDFAVRKQDQPEFLKSISFAEEGKTGIINLPVAFQLVANRFKVELDPNHLNFDLRSFGESKIGNAAVLFIGGGLKYSKTLKKELKEIAKKPSAELDQTALAYVFREPPLPNREIGDDVPLDFLPSNAEQHVAVKEGLNKPVSRVTGPPGTGKSQVAVNLIANLVYQGKSVLFTSKNHKAVQAIHSKAKNASAEIPLVQFCSNEDRSVSAAWYSTSLESRIGQAATMLSRVAGEGETAVEKIDECIRALKDNSKLIAEFDAARFGLQVLASSKNELEWKFNIQEKIGSCDVAELRRLRRALQEKEGAGLWRRLVALLLRSKAKSVKARRNIRKILPDIDSDFKSIQTLCHDLDRLLGGLSGWKDLQGEYDALMSKVDALPPYEKLLDYVSTAYSNASSVLKTALVYRMALRIQSIPENTLENLKNSVSMLQRTNLPFVVQLTDPRQMAEAQEAFRQFSGYFPAWASTLLSLTKASPCIPALFDKVIIDEASQCEIPPMIPALFRAKSVTVIGDPNQFPPVITMREMRHAYLRFQRYGLTDLSNERYDFLHKNTYSVVAVPPVMLKEHFRCHPDIADYFNEVFYSDQLRVKTETRNTDFPPELGYKPGRQWIDVHDSLDGELHEVKAILDRLSENKYTGTIGIVTPFKEVKMLIQQQLTHGDYENLAFDRNKDVNTATGFQGDERDLIIFVLAYTSRLAKGKLWYAEAEDNRYIYNVAVSRARACLLIVGDRERARNSDVRVLRSLAKEPRPRKSRSESPGEEMLYRALIEAGLNPIQQYPLAGRYLDLALVEDKLDIEVDGEAWHLNEYGNRKDDDFYRDLTIRSVGWKVLRFWYKDVANDVKSCVAEVLDHINV